MGMSLRTVLKEAMELSPQERRLLAEELWRGIGPDESDAALTPAQAEDLSRRIREDDAGESAPQEWETFRNALLRDK